MTCIKLFFSPECLAMAITAVAVFILEGTTGEEGRRALSSFWALGIGYLACFGYRFAHRYGHIPMEQDPRGSWPALMIGSIFFFVVGHFGWSASGILSLTYVGVWLVACGALYALGLGGIEEPQS